jgi:hypothetical protein
MRKALFAAMLLEDYLRGSPFDPEDEAISSSETSMSYELWT